MRRRERESDREGKRVRERRREGEKDTCALEVAGTAKGTES